MYNGFLLMQILGKNNYFDNSEYVNLNDEEKAYMDFFNDCLNKENSSSMQDAYTLILLFILELTSKMGTSEELSEEEALRRKKELLDGYTDEEKEKLETFMYACIQCMGIYSEERVEERKLRKERK